MADMLTSGFSSWRPAFGSQRERVLLNARIVAKASKPLHIRLAPEPRHLPLGIVAVRLLRRLQSLFAREFATQKLPCLLVSQSSQRARRCAVLPQQPLRLLDQPAVEHALRALIDAFV